MGSVKNYIKKKVIKKKTKYFCSAERFSSDFFLHLLQFIGDINANIHS